MEAFEAGSGVTASELNWLIAGAGCAGVLLVIAWILLSAFRGFAKERIDGDLFATVALKALILVLIFFWLLL